ncbi:DUF4238 domain-containing protein [Pontibacterium sp. N1Y112]|uniref:DUF4238 domain-containing protein n=1 Tax=Pontibacterium sinense TaxID=2781979 RepID=A0A8J7KC52_9GAMM|nr:DUF4238 domain-containing protein [Pontibacterium sinense]MBE9399691.1 DUF4238 domain-containing protein [Pontibacterium sinense]
MSNPKKHHYVPQFYLRNFGYVDDKNKVPTISRSNPYLIKKKSAISRIGYEDYLYRVTEEAVHQCIESHLNHSVETPISQSRTWEKINEGKPELLNEGDKFLIYIFMRHLESRNLEILDFIQYDQARVKDPRYQEEYSAEEVLMYDEIRNTPEGIKKYFLGMAGSIDQYLEEYGRASISILGSNIPIRTSTNPVINVPMHTFKGERYNHRETTKWLPLGKNFGAMLSLNDNYFGFGGFEMIENSAMRTLNRLYLVQLLNSRTTRHMIADDDYINDDLTWAGVKVEKNNGNKFRCPRYIILGLEFILTIT